jgi:hypothetical protein
VNSERSVFELRDGFMNLSRLNYKVGWVFSPIWDITLMWGLIAFVSLVSFVFKINSFSYWDSIDSLSAMKVPINMAHVMATIYPLFIRWNFNQVSTRVSLVFVVAPCVISLLLFSVSAQLFYSVLAYAAISHILLQQYGMAMVCRAKAKEPRETRWLDNLEMWNILLFPVLWWQSSMSSIEKVYFVENDFYFLMPAILAKGAMALHWLIHIYYVGNLYFNKRSVNLPKLSMMFGTWIWLFFSLVVLENSFIFWSCLITIHGIMYILHSYRDYKFRAGKISFVGRKGLKLFSHPITYLVVINLMATVWSLFYSYIPETIAEAAQNPIHIMVWWPLIIHYSLDSLIWKKRFQIILPKATRV